MRIGIAQNSYAFAELTDAESCGEHLQLVEAGLSLGLDGTFVYEHHLTSYLMSPAPLLTLAFLTGRHPTKFIGTSVLILPTHSIVRLAGQVSWLDNLSGGNLLLGLGAGRSGDEIRQLGKPDADGVEAKFARLKHMLTGQPTGPAAAVRPMPQFDLTERIFGAGTTGLSAGIPRMRAHSPTADSHGDVIIAPITLCHSDHEASEMAHRDSLADLELRSGYYGDGQTITPQSEQLIGSPSRLIDELRLLAAKQAPVAVGLEFAYGRRQPAAIAEMIALFCAEVLPFVDCLDRAT
ncbi:MAG: LLM class flavin-dependent oxidoreductase [Actinomycetota bacterium]